MKVATLDSLKLFLDYLKKNFIAPFAKRDGDGNIITETYMRTHGKADSAGHADSADTAANCTGHAVSADVADKLETPRTFRLTGDVTGSGSFDGTANVTIETTTSGISSQLETVRTETAKKVDSIDKKVDETKQELSEQQKTSIEAAKSEITDAVTDNVAPTIAMQVSAHDANKGAHENLLGPIFRQPGTAYKAGDIVYVKGVGARYRLSCVTAGTTGADELDTAAILGEES